MTYTGIFYKKRIMTCMLRWSKRILTYPDIEEVYGDVLDHCSNCTLTLRKMYNNVHTSLLKTALWRKLILLKTPNAVNTAYLTAYKTAYF